MNFRNLVHEPCSWIWKRNLTLYKWCQNQWKSVLEDPVRGFFPQNSYAPHISAVKINEKVCWITEDPPSNVTSLPSRTSCASFLAKKLSSASSAATDFVDLCGSATSSGRRHCCDVSCAKFRQRPQKLALNLDKDHKKLALWHRIRGRTHVKNCLECRFII